MTNKYHYVKISTMDFLKVQCWGVQVKAIFGYPVNVIVF